MPPRAVLAGLDLGPAGPGLVTKLLAVVALQWPTHKGSHPEAPVPSGKSGGVLFPHQYYFDHICRFRLKHHPETPIRIHCVNVFVNK